jgi:hypothetical protein
MHNNNAGCSKPRLIRWEVRRLFGENNLNQRIVEFGRHARSRGNKHGAQNFAIFGRNLASCEDRLNKAEGKSVNSTPALGRAVRKMAPSLLQGSGSDGNRPQHGSSISECNTTNLEAKVAIERQTCTVAIGYDDRYIVQLLYLTDAGMGY